MSSPEQTSIQFLKGVGPARAKLFQNLGVETVADMLYLFPRRYEDRRDITPIAQAKVGEGQTIVGKVENKAARRSWYTKKHVSEIILDDGSGRIFCVWFNQPYLERYFSPGKSVVCYGKVDVYKKRLQMVSPEYEILDDEDAEQLSMNRIVPVYPLTRGMSQRYLRRIAKACLDRYEDSLVDELAVPLRNKHKLANIKRSLRNMHFPNSFEEQEEALRRISFEEFYFFQVSINLRRQSIKRKPGIKHKITDVQALGFLNMFSFELTRAQKRAMDDIRLDMEKDEPMLRLLQGDVGSGKTVVALFGCLMAAANGHQAAIMAPTEILARQHYENLQKMIDPKKAKVNIVFLAGSLSKKERDTALKQIQTGEADFIIGTHALLSEDVEFKDLSFVVIDEQHKFGVRQRAVLTKKGANPDVLIMTATPIPRTLCITLYGDLDVSILDELPPGRGAVATKHMTGEQADDVQRLIRQKAKEGRQVYVVYPLVEESGDTDIKTAEAMYRQFKTKDFKDLKVGLVHGQMKKADVQATMGLFKQGKIHILVATTVLEVGVDVPNATMMVIEHAERFGLAQLHQLRGRIGRGSEESICLLVTDSEAPETKARIEFVCANTDGFKIAQYDLELRGPGRFFGRHQHGLNELKVANPATQLDVLEIARQEAKELTEADPGLRQQENQRVKDIVCERYPTYLKDVEAG